MIIGTRASDISYFGQTIEQYNEGFWENDVKFWLGSQILSSMTRQSLLVEIHTSPHGQVHHTLCVSFKVKVINNNTNVNTDECSGYQIPLNSILDIKNLFVNGSFSKVEMKIRPTKGKLNALHTWITIFIKFLLHLRFNNTKIKAIS